MSVIELSWVDLSGAAGLVLLLAGCTMMQRLRLAGDLVLASVRMAGQLALIGLVLKALFAQSNLLWVGLLAGVMLLVAGRESWARQKHRLRGIWGYGIGTGAMFVSSFTVAFFALAVIVQPSPWYTPQYAIPILGMLLGNTMNGIALATDRLTTTARHQRAIIEQRLLLGQDRREATAELVHDSLRGGLIPTVNAMAVAGIVSLPGMMTGQILAGHPPMEAVKYQILIWLLIAAGTGFGMILAVNLTVRRLFDERHRLRLDRLRIPSAGGSRCRK